MKCTLRFNLTGLIESFRTSSDVGIESYHFLDIEEDTTDVKSDFHEEKGDPGFRLDDEQGPSHNRYWFWENGKLSVLFFNLHKLSDFSRPFTRFKVNFRSGEYYCSYLGKSGERGMGRLSSKYLSPTPRYKQEVNNKI